jgi:T4-like virus tail tube protein gp19
LKVIAHDKALQQWTFMNVFPNKVTGPNLKGEGNDISVETIEITAEGMAIDCVHATVNAPPSLLPKPPGGTRISTM